MRRAKLTWAVPAMIFAGFASAAIYKSTGGTELTAAPTSPAAGLITSNDFSNTFAKNAVASAAAAAATSDWAKIVDGKLTYKTSANGDHIMDFSHAGYMGGGVALPTNVTVKVTLSPSGGDDTSAIQNAVNTVSALAQGTDKFRGVVKLNAGTFKISDTIDVNAAGVVIAGSGSGSSGTIVQLTGAVGQLAFQFGASQTPVLSNTVALQSSYIPSGERSVKVTSTVGFAVGNQVMLQRNVTDDWLAYVGMDGLVRNGQPQVWLAAGTTTDTRRTIAAINTSANTITFDAPVTDSFDPAYLGSNMGTVSRASYTGRISFVGLKDVQIKAPVGTAVYSAVRMSNVYDSFLSNVVGQETQNAFTLDVDTQRVTLDKVIVNNSTSQTAGAPNADFAVNGTQVLLNKCETNARGTWGFVTQARGTGPSVLLNFKANNSKGIGPHQRWYTGLLVDSSSSTNSSTADPGLAYWNRTNLGSGHGWTTAWSVAWNVTSPNFKVMAAPGSMNWCIGCIGNRISASPSGTYSSQNVAVDPPSLYLQQLYERKGITGLNAIGYTSTTP